MPRLRGCWTLCAIIALGASCKQLRSTLVLDVTLEPAGIPVTDLQIEVRQGGRLIVERAFTWEPASTKLGVFLPDDVSGEVQALGRGLDATGRMIATGENRGDVIRGNVSNPVPLVVKATNLPPPGDGPVEVTDAADAGTSDADAPGNDSPELPDVPAVVDVPDAADEGGTSDVPETGDADGPVGPIDAPADVRPFGIVTPPDLGRYCSISLGQDGWAVNWFANLTDDPCKNLTDRFPGGVVQRAGLYSLFGLNEAVMRCDINASWFWLWYGPGDVPLWSGFTNASVAPEHKRCVLVAAPRDLPIFGSPFQGTPEIKHATGVDFARLPYRTLNLAAEFGQPGASMGASVVNNHARDRSDMGYLDEHDGHDFLVPAGTPLVAVADGIVLAARFRDVTRTCGTRASDTQGEVFVRHVLSGGANSTLFDEVFVSYYAHLSTIMVTAGQQVTQGQLLGESGNTGCSTAPHLHFGVYRTSNTAGSTRLFPFTINSDFELGHDQSSSNGYQVVIDPYGFDSGDAGFDPWAFKAYPFGALSINLWMPGAAPPTDGW